MNFRFPRSASYSCFNCGRCCNMIVNLTAEEAERLRGYPSARDDGPTVQPYETERGQGLRIRPRRDGSCPYLRDDSLCHIHSEHGGDAKPLACRLYPISFVRVSGELAVSLKPSCPSVALGLGEPLQEQAREIRKLALEVARVATVDAAPDPAPFDASRTIPNPDLEKLHDHALALLSRHGTRFLSKIAQLLEFASLVSASSLTAGSKYKYWQGLADGLPTRFSGPLVPPAPPSGLERSLFRQTAFGLASLSSPAAHRSGLPRRVLQRASAASRGLAYSMGVSHIASAFARGVAVEPYLDAVVRKAGRPMGVDATPSLPFERLISCSIETHAYYAARFSPGTVYAGLVALCHLVPFGIWFARAVAGDAQLAVSHTSQAVMRISDAMATPSASARLSTGLSGRLFRRPEAWSKLAAWATGTAEGDPIRFMNE